MPDRRPAGRPSDLGLLWRQFRAQNKLFLRNPFSAFFSLAFPVMFLLLFGSLNGGGRIEELGNIRYIQFLTPGMLAFAVISTCYTGLCPGVGIKRVERLATPPSLQSLPPGMLAFRVIPTCYPGLVTGVAINRDEGLLKLVRGTP